ncbi:MAG TPA: GNAT family N-acetyltransferase [Longimicrobiaceae bacterium]|jgi:GNAT superfamily N-acetyltransferase
MDASAQGAGGLRLSVEDDPPAADLQALVSGLVGFNDAHAGPEGWRRLAVLVRADDGALVGGLLGFTHWDWLFVGHLWLPEALRGRGMGRELLLRAEREAIARGCRHAHLDTFSFQARGFYESLGYEVFGALDEYPPGHTRYFLRKAVLSATARG